MPDIDGTVLPDLTAAREESVRLAGALIKDNAADFWNGESWSLEVHDESDTVLFTLIFSAIEGPPRIKARVAS